MVETSVRFVTLLLVGLIAYSAGLSVFLVPLIGTMASAMASEPFADPLAAVVKSTNAFALDFYLTTAKKEGPGKNILVSPLSAVLVTAMVHAGAKGDTANEISEGLRFPNDTATLENGFKALCGALANTPKVTLEIANKIYVDQTSKLKQEFKNTVSEVHNSYIKNADFIKHAEEERNAINEWVSNNTHDMINDLLPPGSLSSSTRMVLVNAVYFHGKWKTTFDPEQTYDEDFFLSESEPVKVPMMHLTKTLRYAEIQELRAKAVELCYENEDVCLQIILPNAKGGLEEMQKKLREGAFDISEIRFHPSKVDLSMPKFKLEDTIDIKDIYQRMGIISMFDSNVADFSGMTEGPDKLFVTGATQKTFMDVNEGGTEAAAATDVTMFIISGHPVFDFDADHPFMVRLRVGRVIVCVGTVARPVKSDLSCACGKA